MLYPEENRHSSVCQRLRKCLFVCFRRSCLSFQCRVAPKEEADASPKSRDFLRQISTQSLENLVVFIRGEMRSNENAEKMTLAHSLLSGFVEERMAP